MKVIFDTPAVSMESIVPRLSTVERVSVVLCSPACCLSREVHPPIHGLAQVDNLT